MVRAVSLPGLNELAKQRDLHLSIALEAKLSADRCLVMDEVVVHIDLLRLAVKQSKGIGSFCDGSITHVHVIQGARVRNVHVQSRAVGR